MIRILRYNAISEIPDYTSTISTIQRHKEKLFYKSIINKNFSSFYDFCEEIPPLIFNHKKGCL